MTLTELHAIIGNLMLETGKGNLEVQVLTPEGETFTVEGVNFDPKNGIFFIDGEISE